jgi:hypothetical protein
LKYTSALRIEHKGASDKKTKKMFKATDGESNSTLPNTKMKISNNAVYQHRRPNTQPQRAQKQRRRLPRVDIRIASPSDFKLRLQSLKRRALANPGDRRNRALSQRHKPNSLSRCEARLLTAFARKLSFMEWCDRAAAIAS